MDGCMAEESGMCERRVGEPCTHALGLVTDGYLRGAASDVLDGVVLDELGVEGHVFLLSQDGVVELHVVLVEQRLRHVGRDVQQRVAHTQEGSSDARHSVWRGRIREA
jgi:hypothetical protein